MIGRKGQGQIITTIPVMFLVFLVLLIFIILSYALGLKLGIPDEGLVKAEGSALSDPFLFHDLNISGQRMWTANVFLKWANSSGTLEVETREVRAALEELLKENIIISGAGIDTGDFYQEQYGSGAGGSGGQGNLGIPPEIDCVGMTYSAEGRDFLWRTAGGVYYKSVLFKIRDNRVEDDVDIPDNAGIKEFIFLLDDRKYIAQYYYGNCYGGME